MRKQQNSYLSLAIVLAVLIVINIIASHLYQRFDLTENKRYTLSETSKEILAGVDNPIIVDVFLKGEFPSEFKRLQNETRYLLEEYQAYNPNIKFNFINPLEENRNAQEIATEFYNAGMPPQNLNVTQNGKVSESLLFPWAVANFGDQRVKIHLLKNKLGDSQEDIVNSSVQQLEYVFTDGFNKLINERSKKVAIMRGNGELPDANIADFIKSIREYYYIAPFTLDSVASDPQKTLQQLEEFDLIIEAKPTQAYSEKEKFVLDQYTMNGGKSLWLIETVTAEKDSLFSNKENSMLAFYNDLNLTDFFFKYGIRVNPELVNDVYSAPIVLAQGSGDNSQFNPYPWFYEPMAIGNIKHPIVNNIEAVKFNFANPIDTLKNGVEKTILLKSSNASKLEDVPRQLQLSEIINQKPDPKSYTGGAQNLAVLLEGRFTSVYKNRVKPFPLKDFKEESKPTKMLIISDGDVIKNSFRKGKPQELGYDPLTATTYGNKEFLVNAVNYLLDDQGLLKIRAKEVTLPFLNINKVEAERTQWQLINILVPLVMLVIFGFLFSYFRKKRYQKAI
ncbi:MULTISPECIES: gliding motility-associated ABC transporter substrate-binding protein GldG [Mesonia]|uniref:Uncharacterized protein n=1 Tax=Mesonia oceanica TaxID=2687242 RepID=A0AC61YAZ9_9FLAO|nr:MULTISPECIES: gliding motility-associated ABC transporter substrate-binding protein GldG [Mesonia]MAN26043.1 gliding motility-associated ABC transporter substrate-binding protein GldG [Mesonia sp.]MAQ39855.1 gliding motility-associated ABC transporter substrate-binding protein GldG [Mesonia sp.]MBJ98167.1 gliding motility-associated ABC transporter substrate-binding protein GldG [Flavobacteriaceae bacterium]VVV01664.1 hypothetical protein FVB9532_02957 [Mesonia oceanica]|tara:strand:+ start:6598 stop:8283 length:1686 start_codon:yes stop_codon:yes gene_type:complete